jgi:phosphate transport system protein
MLEERVWASLEVAIETLADVAVAARDPAAPTPSSIERAARRMRDFYRAMDESIVTTVACQAPVAGDLRLLLALMDIAQHTSQIANQFDLINAQLMETDPDTPDRLGTGKDLARMAGLAAEELSGAVVAFRSRDCDMARGVRTEDAALNRINREVFATAVLRADDESTRALAMRHFLIARSLERIGDNAVDIAERTVFIVTGELCEFADASHPAAGRSAA